MLTSSFHFKILEDFLDVFSANSEILVKKLQQEVERDYFDVHPYITNCALDVICGQLWFQKKKPSNTASQCPLRRCAVANASIAN
jgi:hypothetical protein